MVRRQPSDHKISTTLDYVLADCSDTLQPKASSERARLAVAEINLERMGRGTQSKDNCSARPHIEP